jgi:hypothetical protein
MVLSKRERWILFATTVAVVALAFHWLVLSHYLEAREEAARKQAGLAAKLKASQDTIALARQVAPRWRQKLENGMKNDPTEAESQVLRSIQFWSEQSGANLSLLKPERLTEKSRLPQIVFLAAGTGKLKSLAELLYQIEQAPIPLKVVEMQVTSRKEGTDDLSFQFRLSTLYAPANQATTGRSGWARQRGAK